ncbi:hypothetical protein GAPWKB11_1872 [Gilliamella apicola]|nr:hypothetical protein GAPWKB11_1872 [Gilliamella apicola]
MKRALEATINKSNIIKIYNIKSEIMSEYQKYCLPIKK